MGKISIVGLGPGDYSLISQGALNALSTSSNVYLRTKKHPTVEQLQEKIYPSKSRPIFKDSSDSIGTYYLYIVKENDDYESVASRYKIDEGIIRDYNQDKPLVAGNVLIIPYVGK